MSIIIHGMDVPKNDELWIRVQPDGKIVSKTGYVIEDASAKQVPPHGRLIDADALEEEPCDVVEDRFPYAISGHSNDQIRNEPTIIEAEEE